MRHTCLIVTQVKKVARLSAIADVNLLEMQITYLYRHMLAPNRTNSSCNVLLCGKQCVHDLSLDSTSRDDVLAATLLDSEKQKFHYRDRFMGA